MAGPVDDVVVRHDGHRDRGLGPGDAVEHLIGHGPPPQRTERRFLDHRPVHHGVGERDADLDRIGAGRHHGGEGLLPVVRHAPHEVGDQELAAAGPASPAATPRAHAPARPRISRTWATSLSPRPDRVISTVEPAGQGGGAGGTGHPGHRVRRLEGGDDALGVGEQLEGLEHLGIVGRVVLGPADGGQVGVLGPEPGVVEPGRDRLRLEDLTGLVLQELRMHAVQHARDPVGDGRAARPPRYPTSRAPVSTKPANVPAAFDPPPTHATTTSGSAPSRIVRHCPRASSPTTRWNSRTM